MPGKDFTFGFILSAAMGSGFAATFRQATQRVENFRTQMNGLNADSERLKKAFNARIINKDTFNTASIDVGKKAMREFRDESVNAFRTAFADWNVLYANVSAAANMFARPIQAAIQFESTMADVKKVVDFDSPEEFRQMSRDILELSQRIPMTADALGQIVAAGGQSGIAKEDLTSFAESAAKMGVAFDITADQAGEMMAKWRTAFKMGQDEVVVLADKVNYLGNTTAASAPLISDVVTRVGPLGAVGGVASGEIAALGASLVGSGISSEIAATGIKNLILAMASGTSATNTQRTAFASLGLTTEELAQRMQVDAKGAIIDVLERVSQLDQASQAATLQQLFGKESLGAIAPLLSNLDGLKENFDRVSDATQYAGSMEGEFTARAATTENSIQLMQNRIDAATISIGNGMIPVITPFITLLSEVASAAGSFAESHQGLVTILSGAAIAVAILAAGMGAFSVVMTQLRALCMMYNAVMRSGIVIAYARATADKVYAGVMRSSIVTTYAKIAADKIAAGATMAWTAAQWLWNAAMAVAASPIFLIIAAVAALIGIGYLLYSNWDTIKNFFVTLWNDPEKALSDFAEGVRNAIGALGDWVMDKWNKVKEFFSSPFSASIGVTGTGTEAVSVPQAEAVAQNAQGGIYGKGAFLTTFAEESPEAAIPLDGSSRSIGLWAETGRQLGVGGGSLTVNFQPQVTIQGNADEGVVRQAMTMTVQQLKRMLADISNEGRRLSYE